MNAPAPIRVAKAQSEIFLLPQMANRHGLIAGATGTGKTVTLQVLAEQFSAMGVPVFMADVKGDLAGVSQPGTLTPKINERIQQLQLEGFTFSAARWRSGMSSARTATRCGRPSATWARCCSRACCN